MAVPVTHLLIGSALALMGWYVPRMVARTRFRWDAALLADLAPALVGFVVFASVTARPIFAGTLVLALMGGFAFVDLIKRATLREPAVFSDISELIELFRHPDLYLPFAGPVRVISAAIGVFVLFVAVFVWDQPLWHVTVMRALLVSAIVWGLGWAIHGPYIGRTARVFRRLNPTGEPFADAAALGPSAIQFTYSFIARDERPARQAAAARAAPATLVRRSPNATPVILVQSESFFDPRRLHPGIPADLLPNFDSCRCSGVQSGLLSVPAWGANTIRSEFSVLTGMPDEAIGFDRFNPYFAFARTKLPSLASRLRAEGYRTICLHPFDRTFYSRNAVMLNLGFDTFIGDEAFKGMPKRNGYITDAAAGQAAIDLLHEEGPAVFIFIITMENHGPWNPARVQPAAMAALANVPDIPEKASLAQFIEGAQNADAMLGSLTGALNASGKPGLCGFYGDHLPSFPAAFPALDFHDTTSDYVIWHGDRGSGARVDIAAHDLSAAILGSLTGQRTPIVRGAEAS
jgi:hypothetical protein